MSGVYIKGFQLPEKNDLYYVKVECEPGKNPVATIWRKDLLGSMSFGAFEFIPVPDHGDLVDRDALLEEATALGTLEWKGSYFAPKLENVVLEKDLMESPAVIPAEEEETT